MGQMIRTALMLVALGVGGVVGTHLFAPAPMYAQTISIGPISTSGADCSTATACIVVDEGDMRGAVSLAVDINVAASGTFNFEALIDTANGGTGWFAQTYDGSSSTSTTADGRFYFTNPGWRQFRVRASAISGTARVAIRKGTGSRFGTAGAGGGDASLAEQQTQTTHLATIAGDTTDIETAVELLDNAAGQTPADNYANPTGALVVWSLSGCWDGATWDRCSGTAADTELSAAAAASDNFANPTAGGVLAFSMCWDGATWDRCLSSTTTERAHGAAVTATSEIGGWGLGLTTAHGANPTAEAAADASLFRVNRVGIPFVTGGHPNSISEEVFITDADGAQTNSAVVTVAAGAKVVVTQAYIACSAANTSDVSVRLGFATATLPAVSTTGAVGIVLSHPNVNDASGGGISRGDGTGILGVGADDEDLRLTLSDPAGGSCTVGYTYYTIES